MFVDLLITNIKSKLPDSTPAPVRQNDTHSVAEAEKHGIVARIESFADIVGKMQKSNGSWG